jgi:hypothetical protein
MDTSYKVPGDSADTISENITHTEQPGRSTRLPTTLTDSTRVTTIPVNNQTSNSTTFATKLFSIFRRVVTTLETVINFIDTSFNKFLDTIKQLKPIIENNNFKFKMANFSLIINKPVYIINY